MAITQEEMKEILMDNGFVVWKWGPNNTGMKLEGYLEDDICNDLVDIGEECFVAALVEENEARFIRKSKFEQKVQGHEQQLQIERIIFGNDRDKIIKDGKLVLFETIFPLNKIVEYLN